MKKKLTERFVKNLKAPINGRIEVFDLVLPGFGIRMGSSGRLAFFVMYRVHGKQRRKTLGLYPALSLAEARTEAGSAIKLAGAGIDPKLDALKKSKEQFEPIAKEFLERYAKVHQKPVTYIGTKRYVEKHLIPAWGNRPISDLTRQDVHLLLDELVDAGKGTTANRLLAAASKLFNWSLERGYLVISPTFGVKSPAKEVSRNRVLSLDEIRSIWKAADSLGYPFGPWLKIMFLTGGQRESDVSRMQWSEIHGDWWQMEQPTKSDSSHRVPLSAMALEILDTLPRFEGPYVFSTRAGSVPVSGFSKIKKRLDEKTKVSGWWFHDVRRTVATSFGEHLGKHPYIIERIQNRRSGTIKGVMAVYNRATYETETAAALSEWAVFLKGVISDKKVVAING